MAQAITMANPEPKGILSARIGSYKHIKNMIVLSLFDGMACGRIALERAEIKVTKYFAAEIDTHAMAVAKHNYPDIIHIGDVTKVKYLNGWLHTENGSFHVGRIDLIIGGSPCQGFSYAGDQLAFDDPRSRLFFEYVRLKNETMARYFLLENVVMKQEFQDVISEHLGVIPVFINSDLVSAHTRKRLYWSNIPISIPEDKGIELQSVLDSGYTEKKKSYCLTATYGNACVQNYFIKSERQHKFLNPVVRVGNTFHLHDGVIITIEPSKGADYNRERLNALKAYTSKLSPEECEKLQNVPVGYTAIARTAERYKMLGNGWTVDVIVHIFKSIQAKKPSYLWSASSQQWVALSR